MWQEASPAASVIIVDVPELSMGWVDPWVGLGWAGYWVRLGSYFEKMLGWVS